MYAHEKMSDIVAEQCLNEMYPKGRRIQFQESDEPCIIYCVLKKLGIMNSNGQINVDMYRYDNLNSFLILIFLFYCRTKLSNIKDFAVDAHKK